jgi:tetratricopeptide (TPR) repeat protein
MQSETTQKGTKIYDSMCLKKIKMNKFVYIILLIVQVSFAQKAFEQGNQFYQKEKYQEAIKSYESVLASGKQSAELYFNLGNSYYKLHKVAPAIYNLEKALQLNPSDADIQTNLDFARKMAIDDIKEVPKVGFNKLLQDLTSSYHFDTWAWIAVILSFVFLGFFAAYYYSPTAFKKRMYFTAMFLVLLGITISFSSGMYEKNRTSKEKPAIVFAEKVEVKSEPKASSPNAFILHEGTKVNVLESIANWKKIQLADETTGWIESESIKELN